MRKILFTIAVAILTSCGGSKKETDPCQGVTAITATSNPATGAVVPAAPGPNFDLAVNVTSSLGNGATIEVIAKPEAGGNAFFTETRDAALFNNFSITNTPANTSVIVEIAITSKACASVKWTGSYRYSRK
ncbi:hypothetical protein [Gynurincola endophyticus]|jgi:hypothetical protein|uniref:hypothetical protein n=1 Tax=Gynurincola endophyticus TaxID=2479004 RepID=UPI000F8E8A02|nr:hypothetical protein [Gynurincola endophyticus]